MRKHEPVPQSVVRESIRNLSSWVAALSVELPTSTYIPARDNEYGEQVWQSTYYGEGELIERVRCAITDKAGESQHVYVTHETEQIDNRYFSPQDALWPARFSIHSTVKKHSIDMHVPADGIVRVTSSKLSGTAVEGIKADTSDGHNLYRSFTIDSGCTLEGDRTTNAALSELRTIVGMTGRHLDLVKGYGSAALVGLLPGLNFDPLVQGRSTAPWPIG